MLYARSTKRTGKRTPEILETGRTHPPAPPRHGGEGSETRLAKAINGSLQHMDLRPVARFSPFDYYESGNAILGLNLQWLTGMIGVAALFAALAWWRFERRDIRVGGEGGWRLPVLRRRTT